MTQIVGVSAAEVDELLDRLTTPVAQCGPRAMRHLLGRTIAEALNLPLDRCLDAAEAILDLDGMVQWRRSTRVLAYRHAGFLNADPDRTALPAEVVLRGKGLNDNVVLAYVLGIGEPA
jgi:hypothetical protein